jgi:hypothetical protein
MRRYQYACHFCQQLCQRVSFYVSYVRDTPDLKREVWKCHSCKVVYRFPTTTGEPDCTEFWSKIKEDYFILAMFDKSVLIQVMKEWENGEPYHHIIKSLDIRPQGVTPDNVADKIRTYLLFL